MLDARTKREAARRQRSLDRRAAEAEDAAREELRRQEAADEARAFEQELDAKEERRRQRLDDLRAAVRRQKQEKERRDRRTAMDALIAQATRRNNQAREAAQQRQLTEKNQNAQSAAGQQKAAEERHARQRDEIQAQQSRKNALDASRTKRAEDQQSEERNARRTADARTQQAAIRDDERRRMEEAQAKKMANRDEAMQRRAAEQREQEAEALKRQVQRNDLAKALQIENSKRDRAAASVEQLQSERAQERREGERRQERQQELRDQQLQDRRERDLQETRRKESLDALRSRARNDANDPPARPVLVDPIPQSALSGSLPWLRTSGNRLVTLAGDCVILRGLTLPDWEDPPLDLERIIAAISEWGATIVRIPLCQRKAFEDAPAYRQTLDTIVATAAAAGCYTALSLCWLDDKETYGNTPQGAPNYWPPMPDGDSIRFWSELADRYRGEPAVLFELFTAPHTLLTGDGSGFDYSAESYTTWCQMVIAEIRRKAPGAICLVAAADRGVNTSILPVIGTANRPIPGIVYTIHAAPARPLDWAALRGLARNQPVLVSEWTGSDDDILWAGKIAAELRGMSIGFCGGGAFAPPLYTLRGSGLAPTRMGMIVKRELARSDDAVLPPVSIVPDSLIFTTFPEEGGIP
jgi:hypothetical protein